MGGTWTSQNKILPGAYINFLTNAPLSITPGDRGIVVLLQEMSVGNAGEIYRITATDQSEYPEGATDDDKLLVNEVLKGAQTVLIYNLGQDHTSVTEALEKLRTEKFNTLCYPYDGAEYESRKQEIATWVKAMRDDEGMKIQAVLANYDGDYEGIINVTQGVKLIDGTELTPAQTTAWVAGVTAGANINQSNTGKKYVGAVDVIPRMTKSEMEEAIKAGRFIFKVDSAQNVTAVYDINSLTSITPEKGKAFTKNRVIRTLDGINNDIVEIFESNYVGKVNNNEDGRSLLRATLIEYFNELQRLNAIQNFTPEDITVSPGNDPDAVVIDCYIQPVDSVEKIYITINLS
ncbi:phage tail sheath subtilisin-like domain-containing protein [Thermoclostridium stercorarium]|uniref:phage tail sheath subtilisin-like domain-containing protein n=1 Tax=Thermoclostridium stercorarium TaxID=1510 RepID=UPI0022498357|nr:phage tail sheath subtilisin-like domain-containing protein [Thermoclostridium stercorarium]UZQ86032.1 phage tail sheath subtilisin-like domain-containing protein [Thermoclostridium stercorarium]